MIEMLFRPSLKLAKRMKVSKLVELPLNGNPLGDWSGNIFNVSRTQYIILSNTKSLYSCLMLAKGITTQQAFVARASETIRDFMEQDGQPSNVCSLISNADMSASFAKSLSRSVIGSMNDLVFGAKLMLSDGIDEHEVSVRLNETPLKALKYANPREVFGQIARG